MTSTVLTDVLKAKTTNGVLTISGNGMIEVRGKKDFNIGDLTFADVVIHTGVEDVPADWNGNKYFYDGTWSLNSDYVQT